MNRLLSSALEYMEMGFSVIPIIPGQKKPLIKWESFQKQRATKTQIVSWWSQTPTANIGLVTGEISNLFVVDIDSEEGNANLLNFGFDAIVTPTAKTPRGGQHLYFRYPAGANITIGAGIIPGTDFRGNGGYVLAPPSVNGEGHHYEWCDGLSLKDCLPNDALPSAYYQALTNKVHYIEGNTTRVVNFTTSHYEHYKILQEGTRDSDLFKIGMALADGKCPNWMLEQILVILANNSNPPFPVSETQAKIKSVLERLSKKERNLMDEVRELCLLQKPYISTTTILQLLHITTKEEKRNLTVILCRLQEKGIIERIQNSRGEYRIVVQDKNEMDLLSEDNIEEVKVKLPLDLNNMCIISPGNIVIVAGSKSSGKTAFLLNVALFNQNNFEVIYLNSEMHQSEFKKRMKKFDYALKDWKIRAYKCHSNFDDYIESDKNKIYIVDYLEVHDNFFEIAKPIRKIHEKLGDSLCFIGIQMKAGGELGRGGDFSAEKSRLYLTMDYQPLVKKTKMTIYDAKEPRPPHETVRGKYRHVKIINGSKLSSDENWQW